MNSDIRGELWGVIVNPYSGKRQLAKDWIKIYRLLKKADIRAEIDDRSEKIGRKIRDTEIAKVPYMLVIGEKEMNEGKVAIRRQGKGDIGVKLIDEFVQEIVAEIKDRVSE